MDFDIHPLSRHEDFASIVRLQRDIWGFEDVDLLPMRLFIVASKIGGQVLGAFDGQKMAAFCLCIPGLKPGGKAYLHSHMLGVLPEYRNTGLGRKLKLAQREFALAEGLDLIEWTFDPLEIKNAFFNIEKLGAIVRRYVHNQLGATSSHLHGGLPTDRLVAEWWIRSPRVAAACGSGGYTHPVHKATISLPAEIGDLKKKDHRRARQLQTSVGEQFEKHFRSGLAVVAFEKSNTAGTYVLGEWESR